jgi:hypothetical protein
MNDPKHIKKDCAKPEELTYRGLLDAYCKAGRDRQANHVIQWIKDTDPTWDKDTLYRLTSRVEVWGLTLDSRP